MSGMPVSERVSDRMRDVVNLVGRLLLAFLFLAGAVQKVVDPAPVAQMIGWLGLPGWLVWPVAAFDLGAAGGLGGGSARYWRVARRPRIRHRGYRRGSRPGSQSGSPPPSPPVMSNHVLSAADLRSVPLSCVPPQKRAWFAKLGLVAMLVNYRAALAGPVALFFAALNVGSIQLPIVLKLDSSLSGVLQGTLVLLVLTAQGVRARLWKRRS